MDKHIERKASLLKALGHPTRLYIAQRLRNGPVCVCEFVNEIDSDFSTISHHLALMKSVGIVSSVKKGRSVFYSLEVPCLLNALDCISSNLDSNNIREEVVHVES